ncbi:phospholipase D-like domain-containing protein [Streptomyces sp. NPDC001407]|uniref:phospholipase D-like domain-containing protein n=1 Tax=Streptomyces sp. NPDC001407 TaxID=3364573 RepID=UPI0036AD46AD
MNDQQPTTTYTRDGLSVFFESKRCELNADLGKHLADFIAGTQHTLDVAIYDLREPVVLGALKSVADRGISLRLLYDAGPAQHGGPIADPKPGTTGDAISQAGLAGYATPYPEHAGKLLHNKFLIRDNATVWTGSANFTTGGLTLQDNNCLTVSSSDLAAVYSTEFAALLAAAPDALTATPATSISVDGVQIETQFEPQAGEGIEDRVIAAMTGASRLRTAAFLISDPGILQALADLNKAGADLAGVYDPGGMADARRGSHQDPALFWFMDDPASPPRPATPTHLAKNKTSCTTRSWSSTAKQS